MPKTHVIKSSFTAGEFSPLLEGRIDLQQYANAVTELKNFLIMPQGGITGRGGFHYVADTRLHAQQSRLIPFEYSSVQAYVLEFGNGYIRFYMNGYQIEGGTGTNYITNGEFPTDIAGWDANQLPIKNGRFPADILDWTNKSSGASSISWNSTLQRVSLATGASGYAGIEQAITVVSSTLYKVKLDVYDHAVRIKIGTTSGGSDILSTTMGPGVDSYYTFAVPAGCTLVYLQFYNESVSTTQTLDNIRVYPYDTPGTISWDSSQRLKITSVQNGIIGAEQDIITEIGKTYFLTFDVVTSNVRVRIGSRTCKDDVAGDMIFEPGSTTDNQVIFEAKSTKTYIQFYNDTAGSIMVDNVVCRVAGPYEIESPYVEQDLADIVYAQSAETLYLVHPFIPPQKLTRIEHNSWILSEIVFTDGPWYDEETTPTITASATTGDIILTAGAAMWYENHVGTMWRLYATSWGYVEITGYTDSTHVDAHVIGTLGGTSITKWREGSFGDYSGYPRAITFHEDRLVFAGTGMQPQTIWGSAVGKYADMTPGVNDADSYYYTIGSGTVDIIQWLVSGKYLFAGTLGSEFVIKGGTDSPITPTSVDVKAESRYGSASIQPVRVAHAILFVQGAGRKLRELAYEWTTDSYNAPDLTLFSEHILLDGIWEMAYQQEPHSIVWVVTQAGNLLSMTYERSQNIVGWGQHPVDGYVESIVCVSNQSTMEDELWAIIRRAVGGEQKRFVEYLEPGNYTDCSLNYAGTPTDHVTGMDHLIGRTVKVIGNGCVYPDAVVDESGHVTLDGPEAGEIEIGLGYVPSFISLRPEVPVSGTSQGVAKHWSKVTLRLYETIGANINGEQMDFRTTDDPMDEQINVFTGDKQVANLGRNKDARIVVTQPQPLPITIVALFGVVDVGD